MPTDPFPRFDRTFIFLDFFAAVPQRGNDLTPFIDFCRALETGRFESVR
jgi:hypothetical protein